MERVLSSLAAGMVGREGASPLLAGRGRDQVHMVVVMTSDRGLCGGFNSSIVRGARRLIRDLMAQGKQVKIFCVGRKGRDQLRRDFGQQIVATLEDVGRPRLNFETAQGIGQRLAAMYEAGEFDVCTLIYNRFKSVITQIVTIQQLIPFAPPEGGGSEADRPYYEYEPDEDEILAQLLPRNLAMQVYRALLENAASEQGARMSAMDSATRNAGDMINRLTINYNRTRQAYITKELIEIISGAEAV
jgi:F-type H+-transporting ATPase subunit gamma